MFAQGSPTGIAAAREGVAALRARAWLLALFMVVGVLSGYLLSSSGGGCAYRAWLSSQPLGSNRSVTEIGISTPEGPQAADFLDDPVLHSVQRTTGLSYNYLTEHLEVSQPPNGGPNPPIALIAHSDTERDSKGLLAAWLAGVREARRMHVSSVLTRGEHGLSRDLDRGVDRNEPATRAKIVDLLARMRALRATLTVDYAIVKQPRPPGKSAPSRLRPAAIGAIGGLIAGIALALVISLLDGRIRTRDGIEAALGIELLADLESPHGTPSAEHAKARLRALGSETVPSPVMLVPCGSVDVREAVTKLSDALGDDSEVRGAGPVSGPEFFEELSRAGTWVIAATPGGTRRAEVAALRSELGGVATAPAGLLIV